MPHVKQHESSIQYPHGACAWLKTCACRSIYTLKLISCCYISPWSSVVMLSWQLLQHRKGFLLYILQRDYQVTHTSVAPSIAPGHTIHTPASHTCIIATIALSSCINMSVNKNPLGLISNLCASQEVEPHSN